MTVAELICAQLGALEVKTVFGLMGAGNLRWVPLLERFGIAYVGATHESGAVAMADAHARVTGEPGVCTVTQGPGVTNTVTAIVEAVKSHTPLLLITGEIPARERHHNQFVDQAALLRALDCVYMTARSPATVADDLVLAHRTAIARSSPTAIGIPVEFQEHEVERGPVAVPPVRLKRQRPDADEIVRLADRIEHADRILVLGGRGAARADAGTALRELAARCGALVGTTAMGFGLFADDPFSIGICGGFASERAAELVRGVDLILAFGASLHPSTTRNGDLLSPETTIVQVDRDPARLGALTPADVGVLGDARLTAEVLVSELERRGSSRTGARTSETAALLGSQRGEPFEDESTSTSVDPRSLMLELDRLLPKDRAVVIDSGSFQIFPATMLSVSDARSFLFTQAFMSLGLGLAGAVASALARPDRVTVVLVGDGGLSMSLGELISIRRAERPVLVVVVNDAAYGAEVHDLHDLDLPDELARLTELDFAALAGAMGIRAVTIRSIGDCAQLEEWLAAP
jgi:thiamine pyrophosphate-dependent acetolactate synthase large subunit-like protein